MYGADAQQLETLARRLVAGAEQLDRIRVTTRSNLYAVRWHGSDAEAVRHRWDTSSVPSLSRAAQGLRQEADRLRKNAREQILASRAGHAVGGHSGLPAVSAPAGDDSVFAFGKSLRSVDFNVGPFGNVLSFFDDDYPALKQVGNVFAGFSALSAGWTIGEHLVEGKYVDAGLDSVEAGGDIAAFALKRGGHVGYLGGVAVQTWTEVLREGRNVDWSAKGLEDIRSASLDDWTGALGEAAQQMPRRLLKIFSK